jgi:hypothetical protein
MKGSARDALADVGPGQRLVALTGGQYSMLDILRATLEKTGPADVAVATWTTGIRDAETAAWLLREGGIRSLRFLVDQRFPKRQPEYAARMLAVYGPDAFVLFRCHAKFALVRNESWDVAVMSSMNLNRNTQVEQYSWEDGGPVPDALWAFVEEVAAEMPRGLEALAKDDESIGAAWAKVAASWAPPARKVSRTVSESPPVVAPPSAASPVAADAVPSRAELLRAEFEAARRAVEDMADAGSYQALVAGRRQLLQIHEELEALRRAEAEAVAADLTPEELEAEMVAALGDLPRDMVQRIVDQVVRPALRVVE